MSGASGPLTVGTAGHIDHGKTALIKSLTGTDTDRLPQEQARGISIELGYARLSLAPHLQLSVVDVPGHERFVRTMVAGATGIDLYLMVIAADDGVMPQTREHAAVLRALGVERGVVAITKADLADPGPSILDAAELLPDVEIVPVSARTGHGLGDLSAALARVAEAMPSRAALAGPARLHIDRAFTIRGAGTVVTGTLWSGSVAKGDELILLPQERRVRVRGVQVHDQPRQSAPAGQRVAVNLSNVALDEVGRGDVLAHPAAELGPSHRMDVHFIVDRDLHPGVRLQIHHGTSESPGRAAWLGDDFWQLRTEQPLVPARGDRFVVRQIAPPDTVGGGVVLDPKPRKHSPSRELLGRLERLSRAQPGDPDPPTITAAGSRPALERDEPKGPQLRLTASALELERRLQAAGLEPPLESELDPLDLAALRTAGRAIRVSETLNYHPEALAEARERVIALATRHGGAVTLAQLRDELGTSRKFAQALLEHLDSEKLTIRHGDRHVLRGRR